MVLHHHKVQFYETDLMGIVHHSNYLRIFEEARVLWAHQRGILDFQKPETAGHLAVIETQVWHLRTAQFGDDLEIAIQARIDKVRILFEYKMFCHQRYQTPISECRTVHVPLDSGLKPIRPPDKLKTILEKEKWIETWLSN